MEVICCSESSLSIILMLIDRYRYCSHHNLFSLPWKNTLERHRVWLLFQWNRWLVPFYLHTYIHSYIHTWNNICCHCQQLLLTYRPDEGPSEYTRPSNDEPEPTVPVDGVVVSTVETAPPPPQTNIDTGDLLVMFPFDVSYCTLSRFFVD